MTDEIPADYMSSEAITDFLSAPRHAVVSTIRRDGTPHLSTVWYIYDDDIIYFLAMANSVKCRNIGRNPSVGICVDGGYPDNRSVLIYGDTEVLPDGNQLYTDKKLQIFRRYLDTPEEVQAYVEESAAFGEGALVVVRPKKIVGVDNGD